MVCGCCIDLVVIVVNMQAHTLMIGCSVAVGIPGFHGVTQGSEQGEMSLPWFTLPGTKINP
jgi:hypothetical protein